MFRREGEFDIHTEGEFLLMEIGPERSQLQGILNRWRRGSNPNGPAVHVSFAFGEPGSFAYQVSLVFVKGCCKLMEVTKAVFRLVAYCVITTLTINTWQITIPGRWYSYLPIYETSPCEIIHVICSENYSIFYLVEMCKTLVS